MRSGMLQVVDVAVIRMEYVMVTRSVVVTSMM